MGEERKGLGVLQGGRGWGCSREAGERAMSTFGHSQGVCVEAVGGAVSEAASSDPSSTPPPVAGACWRDPAPGCGWLWGLPEELWGQ